MHERGWYCPIESCAAVNSEDTETCAKCGTSSYGAKRFSHTLNFPQNDPRNQKGISCTNCHSDNCAGRETCWGCGSKLQAPPQISNSACGVTPGGDVYSSQCSPQSFADLKEKKPPVVLPPRERYLYANESSIDEELRCPICLDPVVDPVVHASCGNMFCRLCVHQVDAKYGCAMCRQPITNFDTQILPAQRFVLKKLSELMVRCGACNQTMQRGSFSAHKCPIKSVICPSRDIPFVPKHFEPQLCQWQGQSSDLASHVAQCAHMKSLPLVKAVCRQARAVALYCPESQREAPRDPDLSHLEMRNGRFLSADFSNFKFCGSILTGAKFGDPDMKVETRMHNIDFSNADLSKAQFFRCDLTGAIFRNTNLTGAQFFSFILDDAKFLGANLRDVEFTGMYSKFRRADLTGVDMQALKQKRLNLIDFSGAQLSGADLSAYKFYCTNFSKANLDRVSFRSAELQGANFQEANLSHANFQGAVLSDEKQQCCFALANLENTNLNAAVGTYSISLPVKK